MLSQQRVAELGLTCSNGPVHAEQLYAMHPHVRNHLVVIWEYEETLANEKWREYDRVLPLLGCAELTWERLVYSARKNKGGAEVSCPGIFGGKISMEGGKLRVDQSKATDRFPDQNAISEDAIRRIYRNAVWALFDDQLADIIERRLENALSECERDVVTAVDSLMNAEVAAEGKNGLAKIRLGVNGEYRTIGVTSVTLRAIFHEFVSTEEERARLAEVRTRASAARAAELKGPLVTRERS